MKRIINKRKTYHYSPRVIHQAVFPSIYISLIEVITPIFTAVSLQYLFSCLPFDFLESYSLTLFSKEMLVIFFYLASTTWKVSVPFKRVVFLAKTLFQSFFRYSNYSLFLGLFLYFGLDNFSCFLCSSLNMASFSHLFQMDLELLLLFILLLYLLALLFKHFCISLRNVRKQKKRHDDIGKRQKFSSCLCIVDLGIITDSSYKLNRTSKA